jgi:ankyrin repeat protein
MVSRFCAPLVLGLLAGSCIRLLRAATPAAGLERSSKIAFDDMPAEVKRLHAAAKSGDIAALQRLLGTEDGMVDGVDANHADSTGRTAIFVAADAGQVDAVSLLLEHGAEVDWRDNKGETALWVVAARGNARMVQALLKGGASTSLTPKMDTRTPLLKAAARGHASVVKVLLAANADPEAQTDDGMTALKLAVVHGRVKVTRALIEAGANVNHVDKLGDEISGQGGVETALMMAAAHGKTECAKLLLRAGAAVDAQNTDGHTALVAAAAYNKPAMARLLLRHGASPLLRSKVPKSKVKGQDLFVTPGDIADAEGHAEVASILQNAEAKAREATKASWRELRNFLTTHGGVDHFKGMVLEHGISSVRDLTRRATNESELLQLGVPSHKVAPLLRALRSYTSTLTSDDTDKHPQPSTEL